MATSFAQQATLARESPVFQEPQEPLYKRTLDLSLVIGAHLLLLPVFLLFWIGIPLAIWLDDRGPVFYGQPRLGRGGKAFTIIKFRTMVVDAEQRLARDPGLRAPFAEAYKLRGDPRVTRVGRRLRGRSLDELREPEHVLTGEISHVRPSPDSHAEL